MAHLYCNGGNRFNYVSIRNYTQNNFGGGYSYGCSMPSFGGIFSNWGTGIYNGCACNSGFNWSTFWGTGCGSLVGSFLGMLCRPNNTSGSTQGRGTTGNNGNGKDTDFAKIDYVHKKINNPDNKVKYLRKNCNLEDCDKQILKEYIKGKLDTLDALETGLDGVNDTENKAYIDNLRNQLKQLATEKGINLTDAAITDITAEKTADKDTKTETNSNSNSQAGATIGAPTKAGGDTTLAEGTAHQNTQTKTQERTVTEPNIDWNQFEDRMIPTPLTLPDGYTKVETVDINDVRIIKVEDKSGATNPIKVSACTVIAGNEQTMGFPARIEITSSTTGTTWYYQYAKKIGDYAIYITPARDKHKNVYVLCKQNGEYKLMQFENFSGYRMEDTQNDNK